MLIASVVRRGSTCGFVDNLINNQKMFVAMVSVLILLFLILLLLLSFFLSFFLSFCLSVFLLLLFFCGSSSSGVIGLFCVDALLFLNRVELFVILIFAVI